MEVVVFAFGGLLLLTAILGGGFEVRELKIPRVGVGPRLVSTVVGLVFIFTGIGMVAQPEHPAGSETSSSVDFSVHDELGEGQVSEQVTLLMDGRRVGSLTVNEHYPTSELTVTVPEAGRYSYTVEARAVFLGEDGEALEYAGVGQGNVEVEPGEAFAVAGSFSGDTWLVSLVEV